MCSKFCVDSPYALAVGGNKNGFHLINVLQLPDGKNLFRHYTVVYHASAHYHLLRR